MSLGSGLSLGADSTVARINASNVFTAAQTMPGLLVSADMRVVGNATFGNGVQGSSSSGYGVYGSGATDGVHGVGNNYGVFGFGTLDGLHGVGNSDGVFGYNNVNGSFGSLGDRGNVGVAGVSVTGTGVSGFSNSISATTAAGLFDNAGSTNTGNILLGQYNGANEFTVYARGDVAAAGSVTIGGGTPIAE